MDEVAPDLENVCFPSPKAWTSHTELPTSSRHRNIETRFIDSQRNDNSGFWDKNKGEGFVVISKNEQAKLS